MSKMLYRTIKRVFDVIFSLLLVIVTAPLLLIISFFVWFTDKGEIFLKDPLRLGLKEKYFRMYKFRSMIPNAHQEILHNPKYGDLKKKWENPGTKLKINEDSRITEIGKLIRKTDMDELPQILNVLKGDMSLVGPRPMYREEIEKYLKSNPEDKKYLRDIIAVRPGMTGVWQVSGRNLISFKNRLRMESEYSINMNIWDDLKILLKTPYIVLTRKGAHE